MFFLNNGSVDFNFLIFTGLFSKEYQWVLTNLYKIYLYNYGVCYELILKLYISLHRQEILIFFLLRDKKENGKHHRYCQSKMITGQISADNKDLIQSYFNRVGKLKLGLNSVPQK